MIYIILLLILATIAWLYVTRAKATLISSDERKEIEKARFERGFSVH